MSRAAQTQRILRRTDYHLLPFLSLLFLLNSLDRSNIGNAETAGFTRHAGLQPGDLNDSVALFFMLFVIFQPVGAALGKRVGVARWVGGVMIGWAFLTALTAFVRTRAQLLMLRMMIGTLEAGFYPTTVFYLGLFYTRYEFAQRLGMFYGQYAVAGAFGGLVSWGVFKLFPGGEEEAMADGNGGGLYAYQVMFLLEGLLTLVVAITTFWWLPLGPGSAWWLQEGDREWAEKRVLLDRAGVGQEAEHRRGLAGGEEEEGEELLRDGEEEEVEVIVGKSTVGGEGALTRRDVEEAFRDWKIWWILVVNIASSVPGMAFSVFLPLVIKGMGHPPLTANLLTIPPFLCGAFTLWGITYLSDRSRQRIKYILIGITINLVGLVLVVLLPPDALAARYLALCVLLAGSYVASPLTVAWLSGNISEPGKRAVILGINGWGNLAGVLSSKLYAPEYGPSYHFSFVVTLGLVMGAWVGYWGFGRALRRENGWRERRVKEWTEGEMAAEMRGEGGRRGDERWGVTYGL
ncbi:uncharacterized protein H6S33_010965 [Morchella sextelata]|uniref:uncharacterized protein n=1 Tax=Morchella sextelata TaxID=1174677 RepID=UPI001D058727|nr:uncharacterized protein H6S33_010965 [Morchella sextelata]KAH0611700.1 hypothetical protein H6S33_010965 [Morchella sextelata]